MWIIYKVLKIKGFQRINNMWIVRKIIKLNPQYNYYSPFNFSIILSSLIFKLGSLAISVFILSQACITVV